MGNVSRVESAASGSGATRKGVSVVGQPPCPCCSPILFTNCLTSGCQWSLWSRGDKEDSKTLQLQRWPDVGARCHRSLPPVASSRSISLFSNCSSPPTCHGSHISEGCKSLKRYDRLRRKIQASAHDRRLGAGSSAVEDLFLGWATPTTPPSACPIRKRRYSQGWESCPKDQSPTTVKESYKEHFFFATQKGFFKLQYCVRWSW